MSTIEKKPLIIVTGASSGIGAATAEAFSKLGHPLLLVARRVDRLQNLNLPEAILAPVDVTNAAALEEAVREAELKYGPASAIINNAGVMLLGLAHEQNPEEWERMFQVNVLGLLNGIRSVLKGMIDRNAGTVINISSIAGRKTFPNHSVYCGTKFAVHAISENLREEISGSNVRVLTIAPGAVETELLSHTSSTSIKEAYTEWKESMGGALRPQDVANAIVYAYNQPNHVCVREIVLAATKQAP